MEPATAGELDADSFGIVALVGYELHGLGFEATIGAKESWDAFHRSLLAY